MHYPISQCLVISYIYIHSISILYSYLIAIFYCENKYLRITNFLKIYKRTKVLVREYNTDAGARDL